MHGCCCRSYISSVFVFQKKKVEGDVWCHMGTLVAGLNAVREVASIDTFDNLCTLARLVKNSLISFLGEGSDPCEGW